MDARKKKVLVVLCIGVMILAWRVVVIVTEYMPTAVQADGQEAAVFDGTLQEEKSLSEDLRGSLDAQRQVAEKDWGRNPFEAVPWAARETNAVETVVEPETHTPPPTPSFVLKGVSRSGRRWLAAVNGKIVGVGDEMEGGYKVAEITERSITFELQGWAFKFVVGSEGADIRRLSGAP